MNRLDLIIDALENSEPTGTGWVHVHEQKHQAALAAAHELKALKPVAWWNPEYESDFKIALNEFQGWNVPLYALDEVKHD